MVGKLKPGKSLRPGAGATERRRPESRTVERGQGIIGPNGAGKTTLLKLLLGKLEPATGTIRHGTRLQVMYFDHLREQIDEEKPVVETVGEGRQTLQSG